MFERDFFSDQSSASLISDLTICHSFFFIKKMDQIKRRDFSLTPPMTPAGSGLKTPTGSGFTFIAGYKPRRGRGQENHPGFLPRRGRG